MSRPASRITVFAGLALLAAPAVSAEVLDKMGGCAGRDPWFAVAVGLSLVVILHNAKAAWIFVSQAYTAYFFLNSLLLFLGVALGFGDPVWSFFSEEVSSCERYQVIGFWQMQALAFSVWFVPLLFLLLRLRKS